MEIGARDTKRIRNLIGISSNIARERVERSNDRCGQTRTTHLEPTGFIAVFYGVVYRRPRVGISNSGDVRDHAPGAAGHCRLPRLFGLICAATAAGTAPCGLAIVRTIGIHQQRRPADSRHIARCGWIFRSVAGITCSDHECDACFVEMTVVCGLT